MGRLIDADELSERLMTAWDTADLDGRKAVSEVMAKVVVPIVVGTKTVDAEPAKHGHWISYQSDDPSWCRDDGESVFQQCSVCHTPYVRNFLNCAKYCPNCGAKMDEGAKHEKS